MSRDGKTLEQRFAARRNAGPRQQDGTYTPGRRTTQGEVDQAVSDARRRGDQARTQAAVDASARRTRNIALGAAALAGVGLAAEGVRRGVESVASDGPIAEIVDQLDAVTDGGDDAKSEWNNRQASNDNAEREKDLRLGEGFDPETNIFTRGSH